MKRRIGYALILAAFSLILTGYVWAFGLVEVLVMIAVGAALLSIILAGQHLAASDD